MSILIIDFCQVETELMICLYRQFRLFLIRFSSRPNGGLIYALEYLLDNLDWLEEKIGDFEDDGLLIDCPGQIELYTHSKIMNQIVSFLQKKGYRVCGRYLLDSQFMQGKSQQH